MQAPCIHPAICIRLQALQLLTANKPNTGNIMHVERIKTEKNKVHLYHLFLTKAVGTGTTHADSRPLPLDKSLPWQRPRMRIMGTMYSRRTNEKEIQVPTLIRKKGKYKRSVDRLWCGKL